MPLLRVQTPLLASQISDPRKIAFSFPWVVGMVAVELKPLSASSPRKSAVSRQRLPHQSALYKLLEQLLLALRSACVVEKRNSTSASFTSACTPPGSH